VVAAGYWSHLALSIIPVRCSQFTYS